MTPRRNIKSENGGRQTISHSVRFSGEDIMIPLRLMEKGGK